ncbi:hypothetical protein ASPACDRAFT_60772 [Aspergillus aculeatus ATCC 16872]|uniref:Protein YAE1 n=1 Tax=Aspergillus aculeatus (strain ATCC 16872 / CBS 172.66 / WB 5094) TaxID=690307 RepID=A0A1L9WUQ8_ASPA1|nr:uncharacterized protein ASPACDRAFT_60772 [Aspergillus aculeatus ATCC 16872]OJJ99959.1 hypothetical protein ASPACDRAFT_60772 [Aspergillus aculeatus ATCC 16872]
MENTLDDIFGSSPPHDAPDHNHHHHTPAPANEPSDLPSLRRQHVTAGYRDGLAASKSTQVQSGFDAGFPIGAQLGMRVGTILGILEGAIRGLEQPTRKGVRKPGGSATSSPGSAMGRQGPPVAKDKGVAATVIGFEDFPAGEGVGVGGGGGGGATVTATASATTTTEATAEETPREKKRAELLGLYRRAVRELDIRKVFEGVVSADELPGQGGDFTSGTGAQPDLPETKLARKAEEVISGWERRVQVALWEENMDALELKELSG